MISTIHQTVLQPKQTLLIIIGQISYFLLNGADFTFLGLRELKLYYILKAEKGNPLREILKIIPRKPFRRKLKTIKRILNE